MAIKGKKKSQNRGSQARRRPAMAPRPVTGKTKKPPWYKTTAGQTLAAITAMVLVLLIVISVNNARTASQEREATEQSFKAYTDQVRGVLESITDPASEMAAATQDPPEDLKAKAKGWSEDLVGGQAQLAQLSPPEGATASAELFAQSVNLFKTAADTFTTAAGLEGEQRPALLTAAGAQVASASQVWDAAVTVLDEARDANDLSPSGLRSPIAAPPSAAETPSAQVTIPAGDDAGDEDAGGKDRGGKRGGSKQDDDSGG